ncbi:unnamed protein product [Meloidogyne enterolobii]|uniref:Uncharacterized protein n=1 Tax=Meloidogyne enterolobii TaxID=390850 RepID=A0ACB0XPM7_MELEN
MLVEPVSADVDGPVEAVDAGVAVGAPVGPVPVEIEPVSADVDGPVEAVDAGVAPVVVVPVGPTVVVGAVDDTPGVDSHVQ